MNYEVCGYIGIGFCMLGAAISEGLTVAAPSRARAQPLEKNILLISLVYGVALLYFSVFSLPVFLFSHRQGSNETVFSYFLSMYFICWLATCLLIGRCLKSVVRFVAPIASVMIFVIVIPLSMMAYGQLRHETKTVTPHKNGQVYGHLVMKR